MTMVDLKPVTPLILATTVLLTACGKKTAVEVAGSSHSRLLRITPTTPVIVIERLALGFDGKPIEWRRSRGRADRFQYHIDIR